MTPKNHSHLLLKAGTTSLALALTLGSSGAGAAPSELHPQHPSFGSTMSRATSPSASPTPSAKVASPLASATADSDEPSEGKAAEPAPAEAPTDDQEGAGEVTDPLAPAEGDQPTSSPSVSTTAEPSSEATTPAPTQEPTPSPTEEPIDLKIEADTAVRPGEVFNVQVTNIPPAYQVSARLLPPAGASGEPIDCNVDNEEGAASVTCTVPEQQAPGKYTLEVKLLNEDGTPVLRDEAEVVDTSHSVYVADVPPSYDPQVLVQYPVTTSGYVMPLVGGGYAPDSEVTLNALGADGQPVPGITFAAKSDSGLPTVADMDAAQTSLKVKTDSQGMFRAYIITSPYMGSSSVEIKATDEQNDFFAVDALGILGESVAELSPSVSTFVTGEVSELELSGTKFAPSYKNYPVQLQLVRDGNVISDGTIDLNRPTGNDLWSSFSDVKLTGLSNLEAGDYQIRALVPDAPEVPSEFRGRLLATTALSITAPAPQPTASEAPEEPAPTDAPAPLPTNEAEPVPAPTESLPVDEPSAAPTPDDAEVTEVATEAPEPAPTSVPQEPAAQEPAPVAQPVFEQPRRAESTPSALEQNPAWLQASSIRPEDPRVERESNQELKSSVLNAQGTKDAEARFDPDAGLNDPLTTADSADVSSAVVSLNSSRPWWPIGLLVLAALTVGAVTGAAITKSTRESKHKA